MEITRILSNGKTGKTLENTRITLPRILSDGRVRFFVGRHTVAMSPEELTIMLDWAKKHEDERGR